MNSILFCNFPVSGKLVQTKTNFKIIIMLNKEAIQNKNNAT